MNTATLFPPMAPTLVPVQGIVESYPVGRIFCVGRNYQAHAAEMGVAVDKTQQSPFYFQKNPSTLIMSGSEIHYPGETSNYHFEMELVVALGSALGVEGKNVTEEQADALIYGYACGLDMTRRDLQQAARAAGLPWTLGKDFENAAVLAPIVPKAQCGSIDQSAIELRVNGELKQQSSIDQQIWNIREIIVHLSRFYQLKAGDLIFTGTPEGVGAVLPGDRIEGLVDKLGTVELVILQPE